MADVKKVATRDAYGKALAALGAEHDAMEITTGICGVFIGNEEEGYRYVLGSKEQNINAIAKEMNQAFNGRGGGKPPMVQGSLKAAKENIEEFLKNR